MANTNIWLVGRHAVEALLKKSPERVIELLMAGDKKSQSQQAIVELANEYHLNIIEVDKTSLAKRCGVAQNQGIAAYARGKSMLKELDLNPFIESLASPLLLVLDQVQDPHNLGACLRTADAAGVNAVIVGKDNSAPMSPVVQKVASGAAETMPIFQVTNIARALESIKKLGIWVIGTTDKAEQSLYRTNLTGPLALVMGAEGKGMRRLTATKCDALIKLPMAGEFVNSLNVSVATGVCLYEIVRQR
ncbi:MAG: 23S rRNA (guanosine(2251)-2'-O)-methyltransferase RlmB, partial [Acidiferrobacterales bacterium]|nr:23S rRNA (guanosine(2251)-2'-O)-methyltransferase RlmB [Acidiferrobacterales bacterium]